MARSLTPKQQRFVDEYLVDLNGTQAAIRAGYSQKTAGQIAEKLLKKAEIREAVTAARQKTANKLEITREKVLEEYAKLAFSDPRALFREDGTLKHPTELDDNAAAALAQFEVLEEFDGHGEGRTQIGFTKRVKWSDKRAALDSIARMMGWNEDKLKLQGDKDAPIQTVTRIEIVALKK